MACALRDEKAAHLGYYIAQAHWGRGVASEACKAFIDLSFTRLGLVRLLADVQQEHAASERILQKFGFKYVSREEIAVSGRVILFYELSKVAWERTMTAGP